MWFRRAGAFLPVALLAVSAWALAACGGSGALDVYVGYADDASGAAAAHRFPSPWAGAPHVRVAGSPSGIDAGAIRLDNPTASAVAVDRIRVRAGGREWALWGAQTVAPHSTLILTQTAPGNFNTSDAAGGGCLDPGNDVPLVSFELGGRRVVLRDTQRVLTTGGRDLAACGGRPNESQPWTSLGSVPVQPPGAPGQVSLTDLAEAAGLILLLAPTLLGLIVAGGVMVGMPARSRPAARRPLPL